MSEGGSNNLVRILVFIGVLAAVNAASYFLDWGFWLY